jgi:arylsulfatase A-like enzyme
VRLATHPPAAGRSTRAAALRLAAGVLVAIVAAPPAAVAAPNVVFIMLDATRADRFGAWGNPRTTTPNMDRLGADGVLFMRHYANAHSTRSSFPQLMTGRYYHQSILRPFTPDEHPREYPFSRPDTTAGLLPGILRQQGWATAGVSAHPWVVAESPLGREFDRIDFVAGDPSRGHADAPDVVQRALALWRARDRARPLFLYLHFMDMHMPRYVPDGAPRFPVVGFDWHARFEPRGEPIFNRRERRWAKEDARAFTDADRAYFAAVYDTRLADADEQIGRFVAAVRAEDPALAGTMFVVTADHGEELGEDGRTDHVMSLADAVEHVPLIVSGGGVPAGQRSTRMTEHVDLVPTLLAALGLPLPPGVRVDGRAELDGAGRLCAGCGKSAVFHTYEDYRAIRTRRFLLREPRRDSFEARCTGGDALYRLGGPRRTRLDATAHPAIADALRRRLGRRLDARERTFLATRWDRPTSSFLVRPEFWRLPRDAGFACLPVGESTGRWSFRTAGWLWSGRGVSLLHPDGDRPLPVVLDAPDGDYRAAAAVVPVTPMPWLSGFRRWRANSFQPLEPQGWVALGTATARDGRTSVALPAALLGNRVVGVRLTPSGVRVLSPTPPTPDDDKALRERLKALGYVN